MRLDEVMGMSGGVRFNLGDPDRAPGAFDMEGKAREQHQHKLVRSADKLNDLSDEYFPGASFDTKSGKVVVLGNHKGEKFGISHVTVESCYILFDKLHVQLNYKPDSDWVENINVVARKLGVPGPSEGKCATTEERQGTLVLNLGLAHRFHDDQYLFKVKKLLQEVEGELN